MKFIHVADMHLGHLFQGVTRVSESLRKQFYKATFDVFENIVNIAIEEKVDFILLAGDEYDRHERTLAEQSFLKDMFDKLNEQQIKVFMIYGNHDYLSNDVSFIEFPPNVYTFPTEVESFSITTKDNKRVTLSGFSYNKKNISKDYLLDYPKKEATEDFHIGLFHGMTGSQSQDYAPFELSEMISKGYDYWALGHIHKREILNENPYIIYAGDPQGLNRTETGEKGFYLVETKGNSLIPKFIATQLYLWNEVEVNAESNDSIDDLRRKVISIAESLKKNTLISIIINDGNNLSDEVKLQIENDEFLQLMQNYLVDEEIYPYKTKIRYSDNNYYEDMDKKYWDEAKTDIFNKSEISQLDKKLNRVDVIRNHIENDDIEELLSQKAKALISRHISE